MRSTFLRLTPLLLGFLVAGCASPPSPIDLTPTFVEGQSRQEGVQMYGTIKTPLKDLNAHLGIGWKARVVAVGPGGAEIEATLSRLGISLPGGLSFDTNGILPLSSLGLVSKLAPLLTRLVGLRFRYVVGPGGQVTVMKWDQIVAVASRGSGVAVPTDGSFPGQTQIEAALSRAYGAAPYRVVKLKETTSRQVDFTVDTEDGAHVTGSDQLTYKGFADFEHDFGGSERDVEGLDVVLNGSANVEGGLTALGTVKTQPTSRRGRLVMSEDGRSVLFYRETITTTLYPNTQIEWLNGIRVANYDHGYVFWADGSWN